VPIQSSLHFNSPFGTNATPKNNSNVSPVGVKNNLGSLTKHSRCPISVRNVIIKQLHHRTNWSRRNCDSILPRGRRSASPFLRIHGRSFHHDCSTTRRIAGVTAEVEVDLGAGGRHTRQRTWCLRGRQLQPARPGGGVHGRSERWQRRVPLAWEAGSGVLRIMRPNFERLIYKFVRPK